MKAHRIGSLVVGCGLLAATLAAADAPANRVSTSASTPMAIGARQETDLLSATITTTDSESAVLVIVTLQLVYTGSPTHKEVEVRLVRDHVPLDAAYTARVGTAARAVSELPVTLHTWDTPGPGQHTYVVQARSSDPGVEATVRRLTILEWPSDTPAPR